MAIGLNRRTDNILCTVIRDVKFRGRKCPFFLASFFDDDIMGTSEMEDEMTTRIAWIDQDNIGAYRTDAGNEILIVDNKIIPLDPSDHNPAQQVINYAMLSKSKRKSLRAYWLSLYFLKV